MSYIDTTRLPYLEVQRSVLGPVAPSRAMPRGMAQMLGLLSLCQSMERPVITVFPLPLYSTRVQASAKGAPPSRDAAPKANPNPASICS